MGQGSEKRIRVTAAACIAGAVMFLTIPLRWLIAWLLAAAFHEAFHCLALWVCGRRVEAIFVDWNGAKIYTEDLTTWETVLCALAGPVGSLLLLLPGRYLRIKCNVYDIEDNSKNYKLIRNANKELGLIQWEHCGKCRLCLKSEYSSINFINSDHVIVKKNDLFGVFNLRNRSWTFDCRYNSIRTDSSNNLIVTDNGIENIYTIYGERIVK